MTLLSHDGLRTALAAVDLEQRLILMPMLDAVEQVGPASVDVRLGTRFRVLRRTDESGIDPAAHSQGTLERSQQHVVVGIGTPLWLHPGQFVLGSTLEFLRFPAHLGGYVVGRSSWGRVGLLVATAIMIQPGFAGNLTLELVNQGEGPIALYAGSRIAQLAVHSLDAPTTKGYTGKYVGPTGPQVTRLAKEGNDIARLKQIGEVLEGAS